jgi:hypothetical protein
MAKNSIRLILLILSISLSAEIFPQPLTIFFSVTGDTICYSELLISNGDKGLTAYVKRREKGDSLKTISTFKLDCEVAGCIETLSKDTIKKYNLQFDGTGAVWGPKNDFVISVKPVNTKLVDTSAFGPKFIYQTKAVVFISCKGQKLYSDQLDIMFKGNSPTDFPEHDIVRIQAWRKKNTKRYFVDLNVKFFQAFKKPGDSPDYGFRSFQFLL